MSLDDRSHDHRSRGLSYRIYRRLTLIASAFAVVTLAGIVVGSAYGDIHSTRIEPRVVAWAGAGVVLVFGVITTRRFASLLGHIVSSRTIRSAGAAVRLMVSVGGYLVVIFVTLGELDVSITHLLVGGALTGVILGIAAQQSLGNVFAGIVLLLAQPFRVGDHIRVRSGALGGSFHGPVIATSLTYVSMEVDGGLLRIPNSAMLAAAVGPFDPAADDSDTTGSTTADEGGPRPDGSPGSQSAK